jgi:SAM-dependent methyltransferase
MKKVLRRFATSGSSMLDVGCGNGWFCHAAAAEGFGRCVGVDVSEGKIEAARQVAKDHGWDGPCDFLSADVHDYRPIEKFDLVTSFGSLHHFPDLGESLPRILENTLKPGGYVLFCEPHFDGMLPWLGRLVFWLARRKRFNPFDHELYHEACQPDRATEWNIRSESPAGQDFFASSLSMEEAIVRSGVTLQKTRYCDYVVGDVANAGIVYMRSAFFRSLTRLSLVALPEVDWFLSRIPVLSRHAKEAIYFGVWNGWGRE